MTKIKRHNTTCLLVAPTPHSFCEARNGAIHQAEVHQAAVKPKNRLGPAGARKYYGTPVITEVDFGQTLATFNLG